jgi:hypothetical protein
MARADDRLGLASPLASKPPVDNALKWRGGRYGSSPVLSLASASSTPKGAVDKGPYRRRSVRGARDHVGMPVDGHVRVSRLARFVSAVWSNSCQRP